MRVNKNKNPKEDFPMNEQEVYYDVPAGGQMTTYNPTPLPAVTVSNPNSWYNRKLAIRTEKAVNHEFHRAKLTNESVTFIGAICQTADTVIQAVPSSRGPITTIVQGCAEAMRNTIMRF